MTRVEILSDTCNFIRSTNYRVSVNFSILSCDISIHRPSTMSSSTPAGSQPTPNPPRNDPITTAELSLHNGQDPSKPIWVAVKGTVFDVTRNKDAYGTFPNPSRVEIQEIYPSIEELLAFIC